MSGFANRDINGLSWSLAGKAILAIDVPPFYNPEHPTYLFYRLPSDPYWKAKAPHSIALDLRGRDDVQSYQVGDSNWQNANTAITWNLDQYSHTNRYERPNWYADPDVPNRIYHNRKRSKELPYMKMVVGAALWTKQIRRYLAVTVDGPGYSGGTEIPINLNLYATDKLPSNDLDEKGNWELISELGTLDAGWRLGTSVFFNQNATEAVATMIKIAAGSSRIATNHRIRISVSISENNVLSALMQIENPYPSCTEEIEVGGAPEGWDEQVIETYSGESLVACDYWYRPDLEPDEYGNLDRLVDLVYAPVSTITRKIKLSVVDSSDDPPFTLYLVSDDLIETVVTGSSIKVYSQSTEILSLPINYEANDRTTFFPPFSEYGGSETIASSSSNDRYLLYDFDLRGLIFFVSYLNTTSSGSCYSVYGIIDGDYTHIENGSQDFRILRYNPTTGLLNQLYEYTETIAINKVTHSVSYDANLRTVYDTELPYLDSIAGLYPYAASRVGSCGGVYFDGYSYAGHFKCLVLKRNHLGYFPVFMSSMQIKYYTVFREDDEFFYLNYLEDADPDVISGEAYDYYYLLTVI